VLESDDLSAIALSIRRSNVSSFSRRPRSHLFDGGC
jgi:hypothetical protein